MGIKEKIINANKFIEMSINAETKKLLNYEFEFLQQLNPVLDRYGNIAEFKPQEKYAKKDVSKLNKHGDGEFCRFSIHPKWSGISGVYAYFLKDELIYIGQALDLAQRFNSGYGYISARCCYTGGQSTNCKMNKVVFEAAKNGTPIKLYFYMTSEYHEIEKEIIEFFNPKYNVMLRRDNEKIEEKNSSSGELKMKKTNNPTTDEVRKYIQKEIQKAKAQGKKECIICSGVIHNDMDMKSALPTVCSAMRTLNGNYSYEILEEPPKGNGSRLVFKYIF